MGEERRRVGRVGEVSLGGSGERMRLMRSEGPIAFRVEDHFGVRLVTPRVVTYVTVIGSEDLGEIHVGPEDLQTDKWTLWTMAPGNTELVHPQSLQATFLGTDDVVVGRIDGQSSTSG